MLRPITELARNIVGRSLGEFVAAEPYPWLVHTGGKLRPVERTSGLTVDRLIVDDDRVAVASSTARTSPLIPASPADLFQAIALAPRDRTGDRITIGVSSTCDVQIDDESISSLHAWIDRSDDTWRVWDNESTIGTKVNGDAVAAKFAYDIANGDRIALGYVELTFLEAAAFHRLVGELCR